MKNTVGQFSDAQGTPFNTSRTMDEDGIVVSADEVAYYEVKLADSDTNYALSKPSVFVKSNEKAEVVTLGTAENWSTYWATNQNNTPNVTVEKIVCAENGIPVEFTVTISNGWTSGDTLEIGWTNS